MKLELVGNPEDSIRIPAVAHMTDPQHERSETVEDALVTQVNKGIRPVFDRLREEGVDNANAYRIAMDHSSESVEAQFSLKTHRKKDAGKQNAVERLHPPGRPFLTLLSFETVEAETADVIPPKLGFIERVRLRREAARQRRELVKIGIGLLSIAYMGHKQSSEPNGDDAA